MKALKVLAVCLAILLASAFAAPLIYSVTPFKFERILSRLIMIFSLAAIFFFARIRASDLEAYGLRVGKRSLPFLGHGFLFGFATLAFLTFVEVILGGRDISPNLDPWGEMILKGVQYFFAALLIGGLEEFFFRGFVFVHLARKVSLLWSLAATNLIYAILHFFKGGAYAVPVHPTFMDSWKVMVHLADPFRHPASLWPHALGLFLFGLVLSYCFLQTKTLYLSMGLHAGCAFFLKVDNWFVASVPTGSALLYGDKNLHSGILGWIFLVILFLFLDRVYKPASRKE